MKIDSIEIQDYRGIKKFVLNKVTPVTVFVGRNNSGKSSMLEAFALAAAAGDSWYDCLGEDLLRIITEKRGGVNFANNMIRVGAEKSQISVSGDEIINGIMTINNDYRDLPENAKKSIQTAADRYIEERLDSVRRNMSEREKERHDFEAEGARIREEFSENIRGFVSYSDEFTEETAIFLNRSLLDDEILYRRKRGPQIIRSSEKKGKSNVNFMLDPSFAYLRELQKKLIESGEMLRLINFLKKKIDYFEDLREVNNTFLVSLKGLDRPIPLESMGDGFKANIGMLSGMALAQKGIVLIEEPEVRLHPGYMSLISKQILAGATTKNSTQFVISTHSIEFLDFLLSDCVDITQLVRLYRSDDTGESDYELLSGKEAVEETKELNADLRGV